MAKSYYCTELGKYSDSITEADIEEAGCDGDCANCMDADDE